jgi:hypothetical protein
MSKRIHSDQQRILFAVNDLERLLDALAYIVSHRQMRLRWGPARLP